MTLQEQLVAAVQRQKDENLAAKGALQVLAQAAVDLQKQVATLQQQLADQQIDPTVVQQEIQDLSDSVADLAGAIPAQAAPAAAPSTAPPTQGTPGALQ